MLRLSKVQRSALFAGSCPFVGGSGEAPCVKGDRYELSSRLSIEILRVDVRLQSGKQRWSAHYRVDDRRDNPRFVRHAPPTAHFGNRPTKKELAELEAQGKEYQGDAYFDSTRHPRPVPDGEKSEESGYGSGPAVLHDAGEAPPASWQEEESKARRARDMGRVDERANERSLMRQLKEATLRAHNSGVDLTPEMEVLEEQLKAMKRKIGEAA